jgi:hypothetical protein
VAPLRQGWTLITNKIEIMEVKVKKILAIILLMSLYLFPSQLLASSFDGSLPLLCAVVNVVECDADGDCDTGSAESVNLSQFYKIDVNNKMISAMGKNAEKAMIKEIRDMESSIVIQGIKNRGWTVVISKKTGKMTASITDDQYGFFVFGACTPL